jgi:hypothetical protein
MADPKQPSTPVFVSYSHKDKKWLDLLQVHLKPLLRDGDIDLWDDTRIQPGDDWKGEIDRALARARIAVFLISKDFLASDFIHDEELPVLLEAAEQRGTRILPVILSHCLYAESKLGRFGAVNDPKKPLQGLTPVKRDEVLRDLARTIAASQAGQPSTTGQRPTTATQSPSPSPLNASSNAATGDSPSPPPDSPEKEWDSGQTASATWVFGGLLLAFLMGVFLFAPATLPAYKSPILALLAALLAGLFGWVLSGAITIRIDALKSRFGDIAVRATGGVALFVLVLLWWPPIPNGGDPEVPLSPALQTLAGDIRDTRGDPIAGVRVSLPAYGRTVSSNALGHFVLEVTAPHQASVALMARKSGYRTHEQYATLGNTGLGFTLENSTP